MSETETEHLPEWTEEELITFYHALESWSAGAAEESKAAVKAIAQGQGERKKGIKAPEMEDELMLVPQTRKKLGKQARREVLTGLIERLGALEQDSAGAAHGENLAHLTEATEAEFQEASNTLVPSSLSTSVEGRALQLVDRLSPKVSVDPEQSSDILPTGLLRQVEWDALVDTFAAKKDFGTAAAVLDKMKVSSCPPSQAGCCLEPEGDGHDSSNVESRDTGRGGTYRRSHAISRQDGGCGRSGSLLGTTRKGDGNRDVETAPRVHDRSTSSSRGQGVRPANASSL